MKKIDSNKTVFTTLVVLGVVACIGVWFDIYWLLLPLAFYLSGVVVGNINENNMYNNKEK